MTRQISTDLIYHVLNRGVDKRTIFLDKTDHYRFIHDLFEFNDENLTLNSRYSFNHNIIDIGRRYIKQRKLLVDILAFCLMPNHYHLLVKPRMENSLSAFMKKLNMGYAKYFNIKYNRSGALFQGKYKAIAVTNDAHFIHLPYYIHFNPLDIQFPEWRRRKIKNVKKAIEFLSSYRWSSHLDYSGEKNFPSITNRALLLEYFGGHQEYSKSIKNWLDDLDPEDENLKPLLLE